MASSIPWWKKKYSGVKGQHIMQAAVGVSMGIVFVAVPSMINMITYNMLVTTETYILGLQYQYLLNMLQKAQKLQSYD